MDENCLESVKRALQHRLFVEHHVKCRPAQRLTEQFCCSVIEEGMALHKHASCLFGGDNLALIRLFAVEDGHCPYKISEMSATLQSRGIVPPSCRGAEFFDVIRVASALAELQPSWEAFASQQYDGPYDPTLTIPELLGYTSWSLTT